MVSFDSTPGLFKGQKGHPSFYVEDKLYANPEIIVNANLLLKDYESRKPSVNFSFVSKENK